MREFLFFEEHEPDLDSFPEEDFGFCFLASFTFFLNKPIAGRIF